MILHTIIDSMDVLYRPEKVRQTVVRNGVLYYGHHTPRGFLIEQVVSTDPKSYLDENNAPDRILPETHFSKTKDGKRRYGANQTKIGR